MKSIVEIKPGNEFDLREISELKDYKELLVSLIKKEISINFKQTVLGPIWYAMQPLVSALIFFFLTKKILNSAATQNFTILFLCLVLWNYFQENTSRITNIFRENSHIISKVYFPRLILPISILTSNFIKIGIQIFVFLILNLIFTQNPIGFAFFLQLVLSFSIIVFITLFSGLFFAAVSIKYRDIAMALNYFIQLLFYITPIIFSANNSSIPKYFFTFNPLSPLFMNITTCFETGHLSTEGLMKTLFFCVVLFIVSFRAFTRNINSMVEQL
jgi:lipopolysaccharide transport system permease protein